MSNDVEICSSSNLPFVTIALVIVSSILRIIVGNSAVTTRTVSTLNLIMLAYVLYRIVASVVKSVSEDEIRDKVTKHRIKACKLLGIVVCVVFLLLTVIYIFIQTKISDEKPFCIINDLIAIFSFGLSVEEETVEKLLINYFKRQTFM